MGEVGIVKTEQILLTSINQPFELESGICLEDLNVTFETYGKLNSSADNCILVAHALTGDAHAAGKFYPDDRVAGWWDSLIGPGKVFDTNKYFVICSNVLGSCNGTTGPASIDPKTGKPYGMSFPTFTIRDMVHIQKRLLDRLGIKSLYSVAGGSMGGMQVLEWLINYPEFVRSGIPIATAGRLSAQTLAYNQTQREAIYLDPAWNNGNYYGGPYPKTGLALARMIATITYKSGIALDRKFGRAFSGGQLQDYYLFDQKFEIENYMSYQGEKLVKRFDANSYLYLTKAMDLHDIGYPFDTYEQAFEKVKAPVLSIGVSTDLLYPTYQQQEIVELINLSGGTACYQEIDSPYGHDGFLIEFEKQTKLIGNFLKEIN